MMTGALLRKLGIITNEGKRVLSDLCMFVVIPCNIFRSFIVDLPDDVLTTSGKLLLAVEPALHGAYIYHKAVMGSSLCKAAAQTVGQHKRCCNIDELYLQKLLGRDILGLAHP